MKLFYLGVWKKNDSEPHVELSFEKSLSSYLPALRKAYAEHLTFAADIPVTMTEPGKRVVVKNDKHGFVIVTYGLTQRVCAVTIIDSEYPILVAHSLNSKIANEFTSKYPRSAYDDAKPRPKPNAWALWASEEGSLLPFPELQGYIEKYQDPEEADSVMKIQKELDETKIIIFNSLQSALQRGEKLDDLVAKSAHLSTQSKMFYTQAKNQNSCCTVM